MVANEEDILSTLNMNDPNGVNESLNIENILRPLRDTIDVLTNVLDTIEKKFDSKFRYQESVINNLQARVLALEKRISFTDHMSQINARLIDDHVQFSMKVNLRVEGIPVSSGESPLTLMQKIKEELKSIDLYIPDSNFDRCHREGPRTRRHGEVHQSILLKMCFWRDRDTIYENRKKLQSFKVFPHLTHRREEIISFAKNEVRNGGESIDRSIDFVFIDRNCKLKVKSTSNRFYGFNSCNEFLCLVSWLNNNHHSVSAYNEFNRDWKSIMNGRPRE